MEATRNWILLVYFAGYVVTTAVLFVSMARILGQPYLMPWNYWWVFLLVTPPLAGGVLGLQVWAGRYTPLAALAFFIGTVLLGFFYGWLSSELAAVV